MRLTTSRTGRLTAAIGMTMGSRAADPVVEALVSYWPLNGDLVDVAGTSDGTYNGGTATYVTGADGTANGAVDFSGVTHYITTTATNTYGSDRTLTLFFNQDALSATLQVIAGSGSPDRTYLGTTGTDDISAGGLGGGTAATRPVNGIAADTWFFAALTVNATSRATGLEVRQVGGSFSYSDTFTSDAPQGTTPGTLSIGGLGNLLHFNGRIDDVALFNRVLTTNEIESIYNAGSVMGLVTRESLTDSLLGYWNLNGNLADRIAGNNGAYLPSGSPTYVTGADGTANGAVDFGNTTDYVLTTLAPPKDADRTLVMLVKARDLPTGPEICGGATGTDRTYVGVRNTVGNFWSGLEAGGGANSISLTLVADTWYFLALSYDYSANSAFYYAREVGADTSGEQTFTPSQSTGTPPGIAMGAASEGTLPFDGAVDDVALFDRTLTEVEMNRLYYAGAIHNLYPQGTILTIR